MRKLLTLAALVSMLALTGCIDADKINIRFDINRDLTGTVTMEFLGLRSSAETPAEQKTEMLKFYESEYRDDAARMAQEWSLKNSRTEFTNRTDRRCDGKLVGDIDDLLKSLTPLVGEHGATYEIKRVANKFYFTTRGGWDEKDGNITLSVAYAGKILEQNALKYDAGAHLMQWNLGKLSESGIHFVLELDEP